MLNTSVSISQSALAVNNQPTMTSLEIARLVDSRHDSVKRAIERLVGRSVIQLPPLVEVKNHLGQRVEVYVFTGDKGRRDSLVVVAQLSPEFTGVLVDRWQELEMQARLGFDPNDDIQVFEYALEQKKANRALQIELDNAIKTKALIGSRREATAMATASAAKREAKRLKDELGRGVNQATITAVENVIGEKLGRRAYVPLRRWCKAQGVVAKDVHDERYGAVKAWPAGAWLECFDIDLQKLFGSEA